MEIFKYNSKEGAFVGNDGRLEYLSGLQKKLMTLLVEKDGDVVTTLDILNYVYGIQYESEDMIMGNDVSMVKMLVSRTRSRLESIYMPRDIITTERKLGYYIERGIVDLV